ncbi:apicoplast pyruvate carrier 1-like isoform X2 [Oratosquilla oratoria]
MWSLQCIPAKSKAVGAVIGGILIHLTLGNLYTFGNMLTYMVSYMHIEVDPNINYANMVWVNAICTAAQGLFMVLGGIVEHRFGPRIACLIGCLTMSSGIMLTHVAIEESLFAVIMTYGFLVGLGVAIAYVSPLACGMKWYPNKKGLITGFVVGGFGLGGLGITNIQTLYLNPDNKPPNNVTRYFDDPEILARVPNVFIIMGVIFICMEIVGCLLLSTPPKEQVTYESERLLEDEDVTDVQNVPVEESTNSTAVLADRDLRPMEMLKYKEFYMIWSIFLLNTVAIGYINAMYKSFGLTFIDDDLFLAQVGSFAAIFNAGGRVVWGRLMDKTSFKVSMRLLTLLLTILFATLPLTVYMGRIAFTGWVWAIFLTFSGTFVLLPTVIEKAFGSQFYSANYGLCFTCQAVSGPLLATLNNLLLHSVGYTGCFIIIAVLTSLSCIVSSFIPKVL